jgi:hypothetical protein
MNNMTYVVHQHLKASYKPINVILLALNNKVTVGGIFCDLKKTFACVNYGILILKLKFYGIVGKARTLIKSYYISDSIGR